MEAINYGSDEETDDASETDEAIEEAKHIEIKEQVYCEILADLKNQRQQLENHVHPEYVKGVKELQEEYLDRQFKNKVLYNYEKVRIQQEHEWEEQAAHKEFADKKEELKENLIAHLEEKKKMFEVERDTMDITSDTNLHFVPVPIRKLRRRGIDLLLAPESKKRKTLSNKQEIKVQLTTEEIDEDVRLMNEASENRSNPVPNNTEASSIETRNSSGVRVEGGKLYYQKYWYHRGQQIYYEDKNDETKISAVISAISSNEVWIRCISDNEKHQIFISDLLEGNVTIKRRSA